jgi:hypothetical protein
VWRRRRAGLRCAVLLIALQGVHVVSAMDAVFESRTLPTAERPLRAAEFGTLFAEAIRRVERPSPERVVLELEPTAEVAVRVADLAVRETGCCSFFTFTLTATAGTLHLDITMAPGHFQVLDALATQAAATAGSGAL